MGLISPTYLNTEDMKAGKYLGLTPKPCTSLRVVPGDGKVTIYVTDATDTVIDSQKLVTVAGTKVVYKTGSAPTGPDDGEEVFTSTPGQYETEGYELAGLTNETTYYFAAFTISDHGMVNMDNVSKSATPSEQEACSVTVVTSDALDKIDDYVATVVTLHNESTGSTTEEAIPGGVGSTLFGVPVGDRYHISIRLVKVKYKVEDGEVVYIYEDIDYSLGADDIHAVVNPDSQSFTAAKGNAREITLTVKQGHLYGYDLEVENASPEGRVKYPDDVNNRFFGSFSMDFSTGIPSYGGWSENPEEVFFMPKPCMLNPDGTVEYYLLNGDYTKQADGVTDADIKDSAGTGKNAMMEWPKIWTKRWEEDGIYHFRCSDIKVSSDYDCWCNYDIYDNQIEHFYTAIYSGCLKSNVLRSVSGAAMAEITDNLKGISYAKANGDGWNIELLSDRLLIIDLVVLLARSTNSQSKYGFGFSPGNSTTKTSTGEMDKNGLFYCTSDVSSRPIKTFGIEYLWSNNSRMLLGLLSDASYNCLYKLTYGTHDGSTVSDYNTTGEGYMSAGVLTKATAFLSKCLTTAAGRIPIMAEGSSSTYECDHLRVDGINKLAGAGGYCNSTAGAGVFAMLFTGGGSYSLSYKPTANHYGEGSFPAYS